MLLTLAEILDLVSDLYLLVLGDFNLQVEITMHSTAQKFMTSVKTMGLSKIISALMHVTSKILNLIFIFKQLLCAGEMGVLPSSFVMAVPDPGVFDYFLLPLESWTLLDGLPHMHLVLCFSRKCLRMFLQIMWAYHFEGRVYCYEGVPSWALDRIALQQPISAG